MTIEMQSWLTRVFLCVAMLTPMSALGDLQIQSAQYKAEKNALYVKGKLTDNSVQQVYVVNAKTGRPLAGSGAIATYARGSQFNAEIPITGFTRVPCMVQVQTEQPRSFFFGRFFRGGAEGSSSETNEYSIAQVRHAPGPCEE